jgi:SAM-dependent methyltransferase
MNSSVPPQPGLLPSARQWWREQAVREGPLAASFQFLKGLWEFLLDSTPQRRRQRYGDADYDWDHHVNTTSAAVGWRDRLLAIFYSAYQPTQPALFHEMLDALHSRAAIDFHDFTFIDLGSGKGRTLLMASDYPFRRIVGVELLPALHRIARENLAKYHSESQHCFALQAICGDAYQFQFPAEPLLLYLFNPFPEAGLRRVLTHLEESLRTSPRPAYVLYHNPQLEPVLRQCAPLTKVDGTHQYSLYVAHS